MEKKAFLIMNLTSSIGGGQKRNVILCDYLIKNTNDFIVIMNEELFHDYNSNNFIQRSNKLRILKLKRKSKAVKIITNNSRQTNKILIVKRKHFIFKMLGKVKSFIKHLILWLKFNKQVYRIIRKEDIRVIYSIWTGGMWVWPLCKILRIKLVYGYNDADLSWLRKNPLDFFDTEYWVTKYSDKIDFLSLGIKDNFESKIFKVKPGRACVSPCSFVIYDNYYPEQPKKNQIVFLGRFHKDRSIQLILEAILILQNKKQVKQEFEFVFIGDGPEKGNIERFIADNYLENVILTGIMYDPWTIIRKSKIFITVASENYPSQSLLEAMACENAIIASDVGETRKLVTENEGVLVKQNPESIADAIEFLIKNPDERERLGKNARKKALEEHTIEKFAKYFLKITNE